MGMKTVQIGRLGVMIKENCLYRHFKGNIYYVHFVGKHSETEEVLVAYQEAEVSVKGNIYLHPDKVWYRPLDNFCSSVEVDGKSMPRFTLVEDDAR